MTDEEIRRWAIAIGDFFIEFGGMESLVTEVIRKSFTSAHFQILSRLPFEKRASLAFSTLQSLHVNLDNVLKNDLKVIDKIRTRRNVIAHNGFVAGIYMSDEENDFRIEFGMSDAYKKNAVLLQIRHLEEDTKILKEMYARLLPLIPHGKTTETRPDLHLESTPELGANSD